MGFFELNGAAVRKMRESADLTREQLCEKSGVPVSTISDIELGVAKNPGIETIKKIIHAIDPEFGKETERAQSIIAIIGTLPALHDSEIRAVLGLINKSLSKRTSRTNSN